MKPYSAQQMWIARSVALAADLMQVGLFPIFGEGFASPANMLVDAGVAAIMVWLIGFHIAFLPSFLVEDVPVLNLAPSWTMAVLLATRKGPTEIPVEVTATAIQTADKDLPALAPHPNA